MSTGRLGVLGGRDTISVSPKERRKASLPSSLRKRGLQVAAGIVLHSSQAPDGNWIAWIEKEGRPLEVTEDKPRVFEGATSYQAQCSAMKWLRSGEHAPRRGRRSKAVSG